MDNMAALVGKVLLPGDMLLTMQELHSMDDSANVRLGPGLRQAGDSIVASKAGIVKWRETPACLWLDTNQKRYVAVKDDTVIGIICSRGVDAYKVDIGTSQYANLDRLAFEGATKRHKPDLNSNDLVFAKLSLALKDMEPELTCLEEGQKANGLGALSGGYVFSASLGLARRLLEMPRCRVLATLGKHFPFEVVVGVNGRVWVSSKGIIDTIAIANALVSSEFMRDDQVDAMVKQLVSSIAGFNDDEDDDEDDVEGDEDMNDGVETTGKEEGNMEF